MLPATKARITRLVPSPSLTTARETSPWTTSPMIPKRDMSGFQQLTWARYMSWTPATVPFARSRALPQTKLNWAAESAVRGPAASRLATEWCTSVTAPRDKSVRILDGQTLTQKEKLTFEGQPEGYAVDAKRGRLYMNYEDKDLTTAIDLKTDRKR